MPGRTRVSRWLQVMILSTAASVALAAVQASDLNEVFQRALQNDPLVREADANRLAAREARPQALSALLPQVTVVGQASRIESDGTGTFLSDTGIPISALRATEGDTTGYIAQLQQSVFRWENWAGLKRSGRQVAQAEADYATAQQDLILRVSQRYFNVLAAQNDLDAQQSALDAISRQLEQADKRFEVGLIAITDVQEARAARDSAQAGVIAAKRALSTNEELLREVTGDAFAASTLSRPAESMALQSPDPQSAEQWVTAAMEQNPRLLSTRLGADIARDDVRVARGGHVPSLSLTATRSKFDTDADQTTVFGQFPTDSDSTDDEIALQLSIPIYSGGYTSSRVRQTSYLYRAAKERLERTTRETESATRDAYLGVVSEISRVQALKQALESSRTALEATEAGYEVGTRTAIDVLDARRTLVAAQTSYARSRYDYLLNLMRLRQAAGTLSAQDVQLINGWLEPASAVPPPSQPPPPTR